MSGSALSRLLAQISKPQESLQIDSSSGVLDVAFPSLPSANYITIGWWEKNKPITSPPTPPYGRSNKVTLRVDTATGGAMVVASNVSVYPPDYLYNDNFMVWEDSSTVTGQFVGDTGFFIANGDTVAKMDDWTYHVARYAYNSTDGLIQFGTWARFQSDNYVRFKGFDEWTKQELRDFASTVSPAVGPHPGSSKNPSGITSGEAATMVFSGTITGVKPLFWDTVSTPAQSEDYINFFRDVTVSVSANPPSKGEILAWSMATKDAPPSGAWGFYPLVADGVITWNDFSGNGRHLINSSTMPMQVANIQPMPVSVDSTGETITSLAAPTPNSTGCTTTVNIPVANGTLHTYVTIAGSQPAWKIDYYGNSQAVTASGSNAITVTGLASSTTYVLQVVHEDIYGNYSNVASTTFTTTAPATSGTWKLTENSTGGDYTGIVGTYILEYSGGDDTTNFAGSPNRYQVQNWEVGGRSTLLQKVTGIASLPTGKNITGARLLLWVDDVSNDPYIDLFRSLQDWIYDEATWINKKTGSFPWNASGSLGSGSDIASTPLVTFQVVTGAIGGYITISSSALTALALGWYNGSITNNGLAAICNNNAQDAGYSLYVNFVNSLQTDGHRPIFELDWEDVAGAADLAGAAVDVVTAAGGLTASIKFLGAAVDNVLVTGNLSTQIKPNAAANDVVSASAALTTITQLNAVAIDVVSATGNPTTQILLGGSAADIASATASPTTQIQLGGSATDVASATGNLSTQIKVGGAAADIVAATASLTTGASGSMNADAQDVVSSNGSLSTQIKVNAQAILNALATAGLTTGLNLNASAQDIAAAAAAMLSQIKMNGIAVNTVGASANLTAGGGLNANAIDTVIATVSINTQIKLGGSAASIAAAAASLAGGAAQFSAIAQDVVSATANLSMAASMSGNAQDVVTMTVNMTTQIPVTAYSLLNAAATGNLSTETRLIGFAAGNASASADLYTFGLVTPYRFKSSVAKVVPITSAVKKMTRIETEVLYAA